MQRHASVSGEDSLQEKNRKEYEDNVLLRCGKSQGGQLSQERITRTINSRSNDEGYEWKITGRKGVD